MIFEENNKAIYLQIVDRICDDIMTGKYDADSRLPSVREYAVAAEVNANTVMRSYERLAARELIYNKRGIGFFVSRMPNCVSFRNVPMTLWSNSSLPSLT